MDNSNSSRTINEMIDDMQNILENHKDGIFGSKFPKDEILQIIENIRYELPREINQAQRIVNKADDIIKDAHIAAQDKIKAAEDEIERMSMETEIVRIANENADAILYDAENRKADMENGAINYSYQMLDNTLKKIQRVSNNLDDIIRNFNKMADDVQRYLDKELEAINEEKEVLSNYFDRENL